VTPGDGTGPRPPRQSPDSPQTEPPHSNSESAPEEYPAEEENSRTSTTRPISRTERFQEFHRRNPHVAEMLVHLTREWLRATGGRPLGLRALWERLRWQLAVRTDTDESEEFKLNDTMLPFYVRLIVTEHPELREVFSLRRADEADLLFPQARRGRAA
jgi:hypothetical protein